MKNFSVLMSLYFKENPEHLRLSLESVFNQSVTPEEVILVEDGPLTDELYSVLDQLTRTHSELKRIRLEKNGGLGKALNEGLKHCSFELVARMDTDDICKPNRFERQVEFMQDHPQISVCSSWIDEFENTTDNIIAVKKVPESQEQIADYIKSRNPLNHPAVMFRKTEVLKAGGYRHFYLFEDWYLWARMFVNGAQFANIPESLLFFRTSKEMFKRRGGFKYAIIVQNFNGR